MSALSQQTATARVIQSMQQRLPAGHTERAAAHDGVRAAHLT